ncbi:MAG: hypothetical protein HC848_00895 [Limnobacter sp.]|nr:hypothetical protein [Limnobacter sp.]
MKTTFTKIALAAAALCLSPQVFATAGNTCSGAGCESVTSSGEHNDHLNPDHQMTDVEINLGQYNKGLEESALVLKNVVYDEVTSTVASIGNSAAVEVDAGQFTHAHIAQVNKGTQLADTLITHKDTDIKALDLTTVAIGNSTSFTLGAGAGLNASVEQCNTGVQSAVTTVSLIDPRTMTATTAAIGNSFSVSVR